MAEFDSLFGLLHSGTEVNHRQLDLELRDLRKKLDREIAMRTASLQRDLGQAFLLLHALVELCQRKGVLSAEELQTMVQELDARDGNLDGTFNPNEPDKPYRAGDSASEFLRKLALQHREDPTSPV